MMMIHFHFILLSTSQPICVLPETVQLLPYLTKLHIISFMLTNVKVLQLIDTANNYRDRTLRTSTKVTKVNLSLGLLTFLVFLLRNKICIYFNFITKNFLFKNVQFICSIFFLSRPQTFAYPLPLCSLPWPPQLNAD